MLLTDLGIPSNYAELSPAEQATHPSIAAIIQLAYTSWVDKVQEQLGGCLSGLGIDVSSIQTINVKVQPYGGTMTALVMRAGSKGVFVAFRGTDFEDPADVLIDADCAHTRNVRNLFTASGRGNVRLHGGFFAAWQAMERDVTAAINRQLVKVDANKRVYFIGHSLGGALAAIGALRSQFRWQTAGSPNQVAGVWLFGCPRVGNAGWQALYNSQLLTRTLRMSNYADFAARLPLPVQVCPTNLTATFSFYHVGRSLVLCPNPTTGLVDGVLEPRGSERLDCGVLSDVPDLTIRTHWLGSYFDAWRRHYVQATGLSLANDVRLQSVMCEACSLSFLSLAKQLNVPARAGGPVTCAVHANCNNRRAWDAAALVGSTYTKSYNPLSLCMTYICS